MTPWKGIFKSLNRDKEFQVKGSPFKRKWSIKCSADVRDHSAVCDTPMFNGLVERACKMNLEKYERDNGKWE